MFQKILIGVCLAFVCWRSAYCQQYTITTVAGTGSRGFSGDGGPGTSAQLSLPAALALDSSGNLYIADGGNNRVRKLSNGTISTVAGNGTAGYAGDNASATSAELTSPVGVALDTSGNIYIADTDNDVIRKISNGTITTLAGNNSAGPGYSGDGGAATNAQLNHPAGVAVDSAGNVFIADTANDAIREVSGANISSVPTGSLHSPNDVVLDPSDNLYIADTSGRRIVLWSNGALTGFAGNGSPGFSGDNGPATSASLYDPVGVARDAAGYVYIADTLNARIRKVSPNGVITTIAGNGAYGYAGDNGPATSATLFFPHGIAVDSEGNVYFSDEGNNTVRRLQIATPSIAANAVVNAASFGPQVSPGALATVFASNITGETASASLTLPSTLGGVSVSVNGVNAPLLYVNPTQVNFQVPWETSLGNATVAISASGVASNSVTVPVVTAAPALFVYGSGRAVVQNQDFSLNTSSNPAKVGSTIMVYLTGSGPVNPPASDGIPAPTDSLVNITSAYSATIGSATAQVSFAGLAPGFVGLVQMNVVVPAGLAQGDYPLTVTIAGQTSNSATVSVSP